MDRLEKILCDLMWYDPDCDRSTVDEKLPHTKTAILNLLKEIVGKKKTPKQRADGVSEILTAEDKIRNDMIEEINGRIDRLKNPANTGL